MASLISSEYAAGFFDGEGSVTGTTGSSLNGVIVRHNVSGTYSVREDCTLSLSLTNENGVVSHMFGAFIDDGSQFDFIYSDEGVVIPGTAKQAADN